MPYAFRLFLLFALVSATIAQSASFNNELVDAVETGNNYSVIRLLKGGHSPNAKGDFGVTPLMRAAFNGNHQLSKILIGAGADINMQDLGGATALHIAAQYGHQQVVDALIAAGAKLDVVDEEHWTPLMRAVSAKRKDVVKHLVNKGADVSKRNMQEESVVIQAARSNDADIMRSVTQSSHYSNVEKSQKHLAMTIAKKKENNAIQALLSSNPASRQHARRPSGPLMPSNQMARMHGKTIPWNSAPPKGPYPIEQAAPQIEQTAPAIRKLPIPTQSLTIKSHLAANAPRAYSPAPAKNSRGPFELHNSRPSPKRMGPPKELPKQMPPSTRSSSLKAPSSIAQNKAPKTYHAPRNAAKQVMPTAKPAKMATRIMPQPIARPYTQAPNRVSNARSNAAVSPIPTRAAMPGQVATSIGTTSAAPSIFDQNAAFLPISKNPPQSRSYIPGTHYLLQLGTFANEDQALYSWNNLKQKNSDLLFGLNQEAKRIFLPKNNAHLYRLRAGQFRMHSEAQRVCDDLKQRSVECFVVTEAGAGAGRVVAAKTPSLSFGQLPSYGLPTTPGKRPVLAPQKPVAAAKPSPSRTYPARSAEARRRQAVIAQYNKLGKLPNQQPKREAYKPAAPQQASRPATNNRITPANRAQFPRVGTPQSLPVSKAVNVKPLLPQRMPSQSRRPVQQPRATKRTVSPRPANTGQENRKTQSPYWLRVTGFQSEKSVKDYWLRTFKYNREYSHLKMRTESSSSRSGAVSMLLGPLTQENSKAKICNLVQKNRLRCEEGASLNKAKFLQKHRYAGAALEPRNNFSRLRKPTLNKQAVQVNNLPQNTASKKPYLPKWLRPDEKQTPTKSWLLLGTFNTQADASRYWKKFYEKNRDIVTPTAKISMRPVAHEFFGSQAVELTMGPYLNRDQANASCKALYQRKVTCIVK